MTKPLVWSVVAKLNIKRIKQFYNERNQSSDYSNKLLRVFKDSAELIERQPLIGKKTDVDGVKAFIILDYIIFYELLEKHILILMVWDCRRDPDQVKNFLKI